ncbi:GNAT family N-acetyltransferase [Sphingomonas baiyangensis]|uniref:GNAT family N-acetyltransferase n=1 Tax=Sphingomonas baiyangensis TaxID=2572576 RepID=A0A4U1L4D6_9SPHN|nr:GNAT family N-acetyltransferase [Sphingomonas baiyangensis]TKD51026.1 GNAT family N-acetyltransferase [Sphingomonas baiyangensis]
MTVSAELLPGIGDGGESTFAAFLRDSPFAAYQQSPAFAAAQPGHARREWSRFVARDAGGAIVAAAMVRHTRLAMGYWLATLQRGPVVHDPAWLPRIVPLLCTTLREAGCCSVQLAPRVRGRALPDIADALRAEGFAPLPPARQPIHTRTGIVWLDKPEDAILAGFKQRGRRAIRAAAKDGVLVRRVESASDLEQYQRLLDRFAAARPGYDMSGQLDARGQHALIGALGGAMLLAERDGSATGAHAFVRQANEAIWLSLATLTDGGGASPGYALLWDAMRRARVMGCVGYDLAGIPLAAPADAGEAGRYQFKSAFAPSPRVLPPMQMRPLSPLPHGVLLGARDAFRALRSARAHRTPPAGVAHG